MQSNCNGAVSTALYPFNRTPSLDDALQALALWDEDRRRFGFGAAYLSFDGRYWLVLISADLMAAAIPF